MKRNYYIYIYIYIFLCLSLSKLQRRHNLCATYRHITRLRLCDAKLLQQPINAVPLL